MRTPEIMAQLRARYQPPAFELLEQVASGTGAQREVRYADALAMSLWPSRGLHLHGFELKVSRGDFLREMKNPAKADAIAQRCHFWWIVAAERGMVIPDELPPTWGLLVPRGGSLVAVKEAVLTEPEPPSWSFFAALVRALGKSDQGAFNSRLAEAMATEREQHVQSMEMLRNELREENAASEAHLRKVLSTFHEASGINLLEHRWDLPQVGEAVRLIRAGGLESYRSKLEWIGREFQSMQANLEGTIRGLRKMEERNGNSTPEGADHPRGGEPGVGTAVEGDGSRG